MSHWESSGKSDEYYTPKYIFDALNVNFDLDVAAPVDRTYCCVPAMNFITENSLNVPWRGFVWMNPPFGGRNGIMPWFYKIRDHGGGGIGLAPDRTSAPWWQMAIKHSDLILFIDGKVKFLRPDGSIAKSPSTGTTLFAYGKDACRALVNAQSNKLGIVVKKYWL